MSVVRCVITAPTQTIELEIYNDILVIEGTTPKGFVTKQTSEQLIAKHF